MVFFVASALETKEGEEIIASTYDILGIGCFMRKLKPAIANLTVRNKYNS